MSERLDYELEKIYKTLREVGYSDEYIEVLKDPITCIAISESEKDEVVIRYKKLERKKARKAKWEKSQKLTTAEKYEAKLEYHREYQRRYRERNGERLRLQQQLRRLELKKQTGLPIPKQKKSKKEYQKKYYLAHKEKLVEYKKEWYLENKEEISRKKKEWYERKKAEKEDDEKTFLFIPMLRYW